MMKMIFKSVVDVQGVRGKSILKFIYLYTVLKSPLKESSQDKAFRVQEDFTIPSPSVPCLFI